MKAFRQKILRISKKNFSCYQDLRGGFRIGKAHYNLFFIQSDPLSPPSQMEVKIPLQETGLPIDTIADEIDRVALCDFIHRKIFPIACEPLPHAKRGKRAGAVGLPAPVPQVLERTAVQIKNDAYLSIRLAIVLPDDQRMVYADAAIDLLLHRLPSLVSSGCWWSEEECASFELHRKTVRRQREMRAQLQKNGLVAFIANGSILPRKAGDSSDPLPNAVPFFSPPELERELTVCGESIRGMGICEGVTLIVGGGFHGKSTLLHAIEQGVYDHIPGDGREGVVSLSSSLKICSEEGRWINNLDLSWFVKRLPGDIPTDRFTTRSASGATSQAASVIEALEAGSSLLLFDEDASAVNFLIRDGRMQKLIPSNREPLIPLIDRMSDLKERGINCIMVVGASGDLLEIADQVVAMEEYRAVDRTLQAQEVCRSIPSQREKLVAEKAPPPPSRRPLWNHFLKNLKLKQGEARPKAADQNTLRLGPLQVDLSRVEQLVDRTQLQAIGSALLWAAHHCPPELTLDEVFRIVEEKLKNEGLESFSTFSNGDLSLFRIQDFAAALYRTRGLEIEIVSR